ncbi:CMD domain protein [Nonomuraea sp. NPDC050394]|uniref:CMD domain protein n=1 Tax=Nonomuraea sp. NPDC050394 TaxID=3364363 RepID=UPI0037975960
MTADVIDRLAGIQPGSRLDRLRERRPDAREHAQRSYEALFCPETEEHVTLIERDAVAAFVAGLHRDDAVAGFYAGRLGELAPDLLTRVEQEIDTGRTTGPYGAYGDPELAAESTVGPVHRSKLDGRLAAAFDHAHLLVFRPREAQAEHLQNLLDAGWSTTGIVTLSQLVAFLTYQVRVIAGLRLLGAAA